MSTLSSGGWRALSPYLDKALALSEHERAIWLESLRAEQPEVASQLDGLLDEHFAAQLDRFLEHGPAFALASASLTGQTVGAYRLISPIGQGGMGTVWLAERSDGRFERKAAVKFLSASLVGQGAGARFRREGAILGRLSHPNIAELLDAGVSETGQPYLVLEYVEGQPIDTFCDKGNLDVRSRIRLFLDVLRAVAHAHANLIVHRDIKPSNVLVSHDSAVKLLDFGIAKLLEGGGRHGAATMLTLEVGGAFTPQFAAPEQLTGGVITTATDVYGLAVLLYLLLTGQHPTGPGPHSAADLVKAIVETDTPPASRASDTGGPAVAEKRATTPEKLRRQLRGDIEAILLKGLRKQPADRYVSADAFAEDLRRYLDGEPVLARPESKWYRTRKFLARRRWTVAAVSAVLLALTVGLGSALWQEHIARRESRIATSMEKFLEDIFVANSAFQDDPLKARQTTARELLDLGAHKIDGELNDVPEAKIRMLDTLSTLYFDLGLGDETVNLRRKAVDLTRKRYGNNSEELAGALIGLASAMHQSRSVNEREGVLLEAKRILDQRRDFTSRQRGTLSNTLAQQYETTDLPKAIEFAHQAVQVYRKYPDDPELAEALYQYGVLLADNAQHRQAEPLLVEAIQASVKVNGDPNATLSRFYAYLGQTQQSLTEFGPAETSFRKALEVSRKLNGEDHVDTLETELRLGMFLGGSSRTKEGLEHIEHAKDILLRTRGADDPFFAPQVFLEYGRSLAYDGRLEESLTYVTKAVENRRKNRPGTSYLGSMLELQAFIFMEMGRYSEAVRAMDEADGLFAKAKVPTFFVAVDNRARYLMITGRANEAESVADNFHPHAPAEGALPADALRLQTLQADLALDRGDADTAARLAAQVIQQVAASPAREYLKPLEARATLVQGRADLKLGRASEALPLLQRSVELRAAIVELISPGLAVGQIALAECYLDLGESARAIALADSASKALSAHPELGLQYLRPMQDLEKRLPPHRRLK
jgi:eukaryotic-like serine/threonine-protein kinase